MIVSNGCPMLTPTTPPIPPARKLLKPEALRPCSLSLLSDSIVTLVGDSTVSCNCWSGPSIWLLWRHVAVTVTNDCQLYVRCVTQSVARNGGGVDLWSRTQVLLWVLSVSVCVVRSWEKVCTVFEGLAPGIRKSRVPPYEWDELRENVRANCPMTARGPRTATGRGTRVSRDGDDLMGKKIKTKKKARTSNKKPNQIPGPKIYWP